MLVVGAILLILGAILGIGILETIGIILLVIGAVLALVHFAFHRGPFVW